MQASGRILLVDDNPNDLELAMIAFEKSGRSPEVLVARSGQEALRVLRQGEGRLPDVVMLDLNMPQMDGLSVLSAIRSQPDLEGLPVVMLSTSREERDIRACYERGASAYVVKPVEFEQFLTTLSATSDFWTRLNEHPRRGGGRRSAESSGG
ncbi:response regulator [Deinococcus irradiatisoli]|uniref:Response regulator n=1 Tax=Deinococcus irradiatisoli TaxID=2202254 RepID=A0A2Z3JHZ3_9DEIO|nr:response regulator [Deinococcus irradiatisoli]AWN23626.1 response regulator [Deinococcus irradiatisoli]